MLLALLLSMVGSAAHLSFPSSRSPRPPQRGVSRIVVGRELSVREISRVSAGSAAEVEAFVHGALCVSYSGQCFSSEAWGGRSANRGQCAQVRLCVWGGLLACPRV